MPYSYLDKLSLVIDAVNNPVGSDNNFADGWDAILRGQFGQFQEKFYSLISNS